MIAGMNLRQLHETRSDIVKEHKEKNGRLAIGTLCSYVPVEIIHSFGVIPVRIWGQSQNLHKADALLQPYICPPVRHLMALSIEGCYSFLDGIVHCYTCDAVCGLYNIWVKNLKPRFSHMISLPYMDIDEAFSYTKYEFGNFIGKLESFTGEKYSPEDLKSSITLYNEKKSLIKEVYHLKRQGIPVDYADICSLNICGQTLPPEIFLPEIREYVKEIKGRDNSNRKKLKILISGSAFPETSLADFIEDIGGNIVADDACMGLRSLRDVICGKDPLEDLAGYYLTIPGCSSRAEFSFRKMYISDIIEEYCIDAVIFIHQKFCDSHLSDLPFLRKVLDDISIPHLQIELEGDGFTGGVRTRIESFFEMLERR
jgi:benzoyl-CoA reductase subunit C